MPAFRKALLTLMVVFLFWLSAAPTADAHSRWGWHGHGWGWHGHGWGWGGHGWHGHGWHGHGWGVSWGGWRGYGWGYPGYGYRYGGWYGSRLGLGYYGPGFGIGLGYAYSPAYYAPTYYYAPPVYSYSAAPPVVIDVQRPLVIDPGTPTAPSNPPAPPAPGIARQDGPERLPAPTLDAKPARVEVVVSDPNADVWFGNHKTKTKGLKRVFETPGLQAGKSYSYAVTVQWTENGVAKRETRRVGVQPGNTVLAVFTQSGDQPPPIPDGEKRLPMTTKR